MSHLSQERIDVLRHNARSVVRELGLLNDAYFDIGVTLAERHLLIELNTSISPTVGEIAARLLLDKSTVSRLIARACKKGYITYASDANDRRKKVLQLTKKGTEVLNAFEPIAFNQTKDALLQLKPKEVDTVFKGVALYAKGLRLSRQSQSTDNSEKADSKSATKFSCSDYTLEEFRLEDEKELYEIYREVVDTGSEFPYESNTLEEFRRHFFSPKSRVYVCRTADNKVIAGFYIKPNYTGRSGHIANAAYMVKGTHRGLGIGTQLINFSLQIAKDMGFSAMQFNMVLSKNVKAVKLYKKLGFEIVGTIPQAVRNPDHSYQDGLVLFKSLIN